MRLIKRARVTTMIMVALIAVIAAALVRPSAAAADSSGTQSAAVSWAAGEAAAGDTSYDNYCLTFVEQAYLQAGSDISRFASDNTSAIAYWNSFNGVHFTSTDPPAGALVFWGPTDGNPYGHVAIAEGNGHAYSTYERSYYGVHDLTIAYRNEQGYPYLGFVIVD